MTDATELDVAAIRARCEAATEGPWNVSGAIGGVRVNDAKGRWICHPGRHPDAEFIAHARTDLSAALDEVTRLRAALEDARKQVRDYERGITWDTTCTSCAKTVEQAHAAEEAHRQELDEALAERDAEANRADDLNREIVNCDRLDLLARAEAAETALAAVRALADLPYGSERWGLLHDGSRYVAIADVLAAIATPTTERTP